MRGAGDRQGSERAPRARRARTDAAEAMTRDLDVIEIVEEERDGGSFSGPKHWNTYQVIARR
ncbi:hypothetical protein GCM10028787_02880 [Brachybacterium horti]